MIEPVGKINRIIQVLQMQDINGQKAFVHKITSVCQHRHCLTRRKEGPEYLNFLAEDAACDIAAFLNYREPRILTLFSRTSKLMMNCELYARNLDLEIAQPQRHVEYT